MLKLTKKSLLVIIASVYCGCLIISNIIAGKTFGVLGISLPCAVVIFPLVYIINDVLTEIYGFKTARNVVLLGFAMNVIAVLAYTATVILPPSQFFDAQSAYETVLGTTPRMLAASLSAYLVGSLANAKVMDGMKRAMPKHLMARCIGSTLVGETIDATIFITVAFAGTMPIGSLAVMVVAQAAFKTLYEIVVFPITRAAIVKARTLEEG